MLFPRCSPAPPAATPYSPGHVSLTGFEPATSWPPATRATQLRHKLITPKGGGRDWLPASSGSELPQSKIRCTRAQALARPGSGSLLQPSRGCALGSRSRTAVIPRPERRDYSGTTSAARPCGMSAGNQHGLSPPHTARACCIPLCDSPRLSGQARTGDLMLPKHARYLLRYTQIVKLLGLEPRSYRRPSTAYMALPLSYSLMKPDPLP